MALIPGLWWPEVLESLNSTPGETEGNRSENTNSLGRLIRREETRTKVLWTPWGRAGWDFRGHLNPFWVRKQA